MEARDGVGDVSEIRNDGLLACTGLGTGRKLYEYIFLARVVKQQVNTIVILYSLHTGVLPRYSHLDSNLEKHNFWSGIPHLSWVPFSKRSFESLFYTSSNSRFFGTILVFPKGLRCSHKEPPCPRTSSSPLLVNVVLWDNTCVSRRPRSS